MTEVERIIKNGILSEDFFKPETICDFYVDEKRKKVWAIGIDMLLEFDRICRKHGLKYILNGGTALGAIRHKGFIPWDDDVDIAMPRDDYERFIEIGAQELRPPYFLQTPLTDKGYYFSYAKIRNSNTSCISYPFRYESFNQGIALDVLVFDSCAREEMEATNERVAALIADNSAYMRRSNPAPDEDDLRRINSHSGRDPMDVCREFTEIATKYRYVDTGYIADILSIVYNVNRRIWRNDLFDEIVYEDFEGFSFPLPKDYDHFLSVLFGDYMQLPPAEQRGNWHSGEILDPDVPYTELIKTLR